VGFYLTRVDHYSAWVDYGALYDYLGIRQVDSSLAGNENGCWKMIPHHLLDLT
jgi:hypothetical protein